MDAVIAAVDRGPLGVVPVDRLGDGELRFVALALVLLTGPGVLDVDTSTELLPAGQVLTVLGDGLDLGLDRRQLRELLRLAGMAAARGHIRLLGTVQDADCAQGLGGVTVARLGEGRRVSAQGAGEAEFGAGAGAGAAPRERGGHLDAAGGGGRSAERGTEAGGVTAPGPDTGATDGGAAGRAGAGHAAEEAGREEEGCGDAVDQSG